MSPSIPTPLFEISTAYKHMLSIQRDENNMWALFAYMTGSRFQYCPDFKGETVGIESYQVSDCFDDYYNLLNRVYDYNIFLAQEHPENNRLVDILKTITDAFNTKYDGSFKQKNFIAKIRTNLSLSGIDIKTTQITPYEPCKGWVISKDDIDRHIEIISGEPVFAVRTLSDSGNSDYYVYQLRLKQPVTLKSRYMFLQDPCVHIALFKTPEDANTYYDNAVKNSLIFKKDIGYEQLAEKCSPAIQRFESYFSQKSK